MIDKFLDYLSTEKRYSIHTLTSYRKDLEDFLSFLAETEGTEDLRKADKKVVRNFMVSLTEKKLHKRSINRKLSSLRSFYLFLLKIQEISVSPMETIASLKFYAEKQIPMSVDEMNHLAEIMQGEEGLLENLIVELLYQTGMRRAELCGLKQEQIDFSKSEITIHGKGNKERIVPVSRELLISLQKYNENKPKTEHSSVYFFVQNNGKKLSEKFVYSAVNSYLSLVTTKKKKSPHILRHSFATHILNEGAEISKVKKILGHASLASTQVYTNGDIEQLKKVFNKAHPRANREEQ